MCFNGLLLLWGTAVPEVAACAMAGLILFLYACIHGICYLFWGHNVLGSLLCGGWGRL